MAESKGALLAKSVQKHAGRAKEKILQNLGKVDRTADEIFDEHLQNFTRQQNAANRLQKEFNNYIRCVRAVQAASKTLMDSLNEIYESNWTGHDLLYVQAQNCEMLWQDFSHKLGDQVLIPLNTYQSQFPEMRKKIEKRGRKLVDFDSQRHSYQSLQQSNPKKRDELKMVRARESLEEAKRTYEMLNSELHDELPALYDSRVLFLVTNLQTFFAAEQVFHCESAKVFGELEAIVDKLATECQRGSYTVKKSSPKSPKISTSNNNMIQSVPSSPTSIGAGDDNQGPPPPSPSSPPPSAPSPEPAAENPPPTAAAPPRAEAAPKEGDEPRPQVNGNAKPTPTSAVPDGTAPGKKVEELYDIPVGATTDNLPPGVLYRVKATYKYNREDVDELSFDVGEIIRVVEYDDPEEQEEGWLMGVKEGTGEKGMFPANFTRPL
ncbi:myc box-dependent-interacting protein 1 isoform X1 [Schistocerca americana]|uniref:myc box-dependent-interacting protein 1 isoform X1 n=1 Tax=Schistocerca americana TaxID=7009 RepID=UPI001F4FC3FF|nr:myc box-dependent-interacting protein 1 isoform X1 [Schistocerca americana]